VEYIWSIYRRLFVFVCIVTVNVYNVSSDVLIKMAIGTKAVQMFPQKYSPPRGSSVVAVATLGLCLCL
jgi:hypothetical protein